MTKLGEPAYWDGFSSNGAVAHYSPDGSRFVVVLRKGNLAANTNEFTLLLWQTRELFRQPRPRQLLTLASSSNRPALEAITWLADNESIAFLGEHPGESHQLYTFNTRTRRLTRVTACPTNVISYTFSRDGRVLAYTTEPPDAPAIDVRARRDGVLVSGQSLIDLVTDKLGRWGRPNELYVKVRGGTARRLKTLGGVFNWFGAPSLSPDGSYLLVAANVTGDSYPPEWKEYTDPWLRRKLDAPLPAGEFSSVQRYELIDTRTGRSQRLIDDAPAGKHASEAAWAPDGKSVVVTNVFLPLRDVSAEERTLRQGTAFTVEVEVPSLRLHPVTHADLVLRGWDSSGRTLVFNGARDDYSTEARPPRLFQQTTGRWEEIVPTVHAQLPPAITLEEDMNTPPQIFATGLASKEKVKLLDLNPQFKHLAFGRVEDIRWQDAQGRTLKGLLYFPVSYTPGRRYPLVIQTHAYEPHRFWIDGAWTTAYAAQPLAGKGIVVLQVGYNDGLNTPDEAPGELANYESAIAHLDHLGLVDLNRIGLIGFSRTAFHVKYALIHSKYRFAAASVTDGVDLGYVQYVVGLNSIAEGTAFEEKLNGGLPWGPGLQRWVEHAPGFDLDKVTTPLRIIALNSTGSLVGEWEWFAGLHHLGKPVEMVVIPDGVHLLQRPWDRLISQQGNVDWFAYWLQGEEDGDAAKRDQYARWRALRRLHEQQVANDTAATQHGSD